MAGKTPHLDLTGGEVKDMVHLFIREEFDRLPFIPTRAPKCSDADKVPFDGMLGLGDLKKRIKDDYDSSCPDDKNSSVNDPFKAAAIRGVTLTMIRVFAVEFVMQTIFSYGEYTVEDFTDANKMMEDTVQVMQSSQLHSAVKRHICIQFFPMHTVTGN